MPKNAVLSADFAKALEIGRSPNIKRLFPDSRALIVSGKMADRAVTAKGKRQQSNGRLHTENANVWKAKCATMGKELVTQWQHSGRRPKVFLSVSFSENEYISGLMLLLEKEGFEVITGMSSDGYVSQYVLRRIEEADYVLCLMTRDKQKADGTYTTSPWLLEELGAALAFGKPMALVVEEGIDDIGGLQGDWKKSISRRKVF